MKEEQQELDLGKLKRNRSKAITHLQAIDITKWLQENRQSIIRERKTATKVAKLASECLGHPISSSTIITLSSHDSIRIDYTELRSKKSKNGDTGNDLEHRVIELEKTVTILTEMISEIKRTAK